MINRDVIFTYKDNLLLQFMPKFKLYKCDNSFPQPPSEIAHHPYFIEYEVSEVSPKRGITDYSYNLKDKPRYEDHIESPLPVEILQFEENIRIKNEILYLLNALTDTYLFYYGMNGTRQSWTIGLEEEHSVRYSQEGYLCPDYNRHPDSIVPQPNYELLDPALLYLRNTEGELAKTVKLNELLRTYYDSEDLELKEQYLCACIVLTKAQDFLSIDHSASFIFMVSAIEALISIEYKDHVVENCACCGQPKYKVSKKFKDFVDKYGYEVSNKVKNEFYSMRSSISHFGKMFVSSYQPSMFIESQKGFDRRHKEMMERLKFESFSNLAKTCFRTFLLENL